MAVGKKSGGREKGTPNKKKSNEDALTKLLKDYTPEAIAKAFKKAKKSVGKKKTIIEHLCEKAFADNILAQFLLKFMIAPKKQSEAPQVLDGSNKWAHKTPSDICDEMDDLTSKDPERLT